MQATEGLPGRLSITTRYDPARVSIQAKQEALQKSQEEEKGQKKKKKKKRLSEIRFILSLLGTTDWNLDGGRGKRSTKDSKTPSNLLAILGKANLRRLPACWPNGYRTGGARKSTVTHVHGDSEPITWRVYGLEGNSFWRADGAGFSGGGWDCWKMKGVRLTACAQVLLWGVSGGPWKDRVARGGHVSRSPAQLVFSRFDRDLAHRPKLHSNTDLKWRGWLAARKENKEISHYFQKKIRKKNIPPASKGSSPRPPSQTFIIVDGLCGLENTLCLNLSSPHPSGTHSLACFRKAV